MAPSSVLVAKLKVHLKLSISRLRIVQQKDTAVAKQQRRAMALLLEQGKHASARIRVENIIRSDLTTELHEILELYCELLLARIGLLEAPPPCDPGLSEAVNAILYAAPRTDVKELNTVRLLLVEKFGKDTAALALKGEGVEERVKRKLRVEPPGEELVESYLRAIAAAYDVRYGDEGADEQEADAGDNNNINNGNGGDDGDDGEEGGGGGGAKEAPIPLSLALPTQDLKTKTLTPPRNLGPKSPVSVAPPSPSTDNANPRLRLPGAGTAGGGGAGAKTGGAGVGAAAGVGKVNGGGLGGGLGAKPNGATTASAAVGPKGKVEGNVPDVDDLEKRFALLKK